MHHQQIWKKKSNKVLGHFWKFKTPRYADWMNHFDEIVEKPVVSIKSDRGYKIRRV